jgi:succinoglycan biosynthesis transport protein ExoP
MGGVPVDTNVNSTYPEEISLRELIETLIRGWKLIVAITLLAVLISAVVSFFVIKPTYEASVTLMASAAAKVEAPRTGNGISGFLDAMSDLPVPTLDTYREQVKNLVVLQNALDDLGLGPDRLTRRELSSKVSVEIVNNTNLIRIKVRDGDPKLAADLADSLADNFTKYVSDLAKEQALTSYMYLEKQMNVEKEMLDRALTGYKEFLAQPRGVQELQAEIDSRLLFVTDFTMQYMQKEVEEKAKKAALETLQQELAQTEKILVTKKSLSEDAFLNNVISEATGQSTLQTGQVMMENQEINPNYLALENSISILRSELAMLASERQNIKSQIDRNSAELERLQAELAEKQHQENILKRNVDLAQQTYDAFYSKYEEVRITQSSQVGEASIVVATPAVEPSVPVSPNKRLNVAIAGVLGLMVSVFVVFIKDYWEKTGQEGSLK